MDDGIARVADREQRTSLRSVGRQVTFNSFATAMVASGLLFLLRGP
jgi:hypothetical protein